jgi:hypothetical protein
MNYADTLCRVYDPDAISTMGRAFDKAVRGLSQQSKADSDIRQNLARCIIRLFDEGERAPINLSIIASSIVIGAGRKRVSTNASLIATLLVSRSPRTLMGRPIAA